MSQPLISVLLPVFNAGNYLRISVFSILKQTYQNWELLILDDGSTDDALTYISDLNDERIRVIKGNSNLGVTVRLNQGIEMAKGDYVARMDQDDISYPRRFELQLKFLISNPHVDLLSTKCVAIDKDNHLVGLMPYRLNHHEICSKPWSGFYMPHPTWMGKKNWFKQFMYADPGPYFCDDQELLLRSFYGSQFACLDEVLFAYRVRNQTNFIKNLKIRFTLLKIQLRIFFDRRHWIAFLMATPSAVLKIIFDGYRFFVKVGPVNVKQSTDPQISQNWCSVLESIRES